LKFDEKIIVFIYTLEKYSCLIVFIALGMIFYDQEINLIENEEEEKKK
jgi:hypothetical protein